jgi:hypothetical protein
MSSRKKIRQAPGRLLRQKLVISVRCVARVETLPLKGPRLLIRHWILYAEKPHTDRSPKATRARLYPARLKQTRQNNDLVQVRQQLKTTTNSTDAHVRRTPTMTNQHSRQGIFHDSLGKKKHNQLLHDT